MSNTEPGDAVKFDNAWNTKDTARVVYSKYHWKYADVGYYDRISLLFSKQDRVGFIETIISPQCQ